MGKGIYLIALLIFTLACVSQQPTKETTLTVSQGLGVTYFGVPTIGGQSPSFSVQRIRPSEEGYLSLILRNNAGGDKAEDVVVSLDNVRPFKMVECGDVHEETEIRTDEEAQCVSWLDNADKPFRSFGIPVIAPNEELELIYVLKAPSKDQIANVYYEQEIFYTMQYKYKTSAFQSIVGFSQEEYNNQVRSGTLSPLNQTNTAGAMNIKSKVKSPVIYTLGKDKDFLLEFEVSNVGTGNLVAGSKINVTVTYPTSVVPNLALGTGADTVLNLNEICSGLNLAPIEAKELWSSKKLSFAVNECTVDPDCGAKCTDGVSYTSGTCDTGQCSYSNGLACESGSCNADGIACLDTGVVSECTVNSDCTSSCEGGVYYKAKCNVDGTCGLGTGITCVSGVCDGNVCGDIVIEEPITVPTPIEEPIEPIQRCTWFTEEYGASTERVLMIQLNSIDLTTARTIVLPFTLKQTSAPIVSAPFFIRSSYTYGDEGSTKIGVSPVK